MAKQISPASSTTSASAAPATKEKSKYQTMIVGVPAAMKDTHAKLDALATKLGCRASALVWEGVNRVLAAPPTAAPAGATASTGSAPGFWAGPVRDAKNQKVIGASVTEVAARGDGQGQTFFRFDKEDAKARTRALNQAKRGAQYILDLVGIKGEPTVVEL